MMEMMTAVITEIRDATANDIKEQIRF